MKKYDWIKRCLWVALGATALLCDLSHRLYRMSYYSLAFHTPEPPAFHDLCLFAAYLKAHNSVDSCINNLRQIDGVKAQWIVEHHIDNTNDVTLTWADITPYVGGGKRLWCPQNGTYRIGTLAETSTCSINSHKLR